MQDQSPNFSNFWVHAVTLAGIESADLLSCSFDPARRIYADDKYIYKMVLLRHDKMSHLRAQGFEGEFNILRHCTGIPGIPAAIEYRRYEDIQVLVLERLPGGPVSNLEIGLFGLLAVIGKLSVIIYRLSRRGIRHNDFRLENILLSQDGKVSLIDFDQATWSGFLTGIISSFTGIKLGGAKVQFSVMMIGKEYLKKKLPPRAIRFLKKITGRGVEYGSLPVLPEEANPQLRMLLDAWKLAQMSDASSPGIQVAYYSLDFDNHHFPGERPWMDRWNVLRSVTDYSGKRILELGCNMSLLSCYLLKEGRASAALAVDVDRNILEAAELVSSAFGVKPVYKQQDLDVQNDWEAELANFKPDIIFALNVLNWVRDKNRFMKFLGRFNEIIFEGHDSIEIEKSRFQSLGGFRHINQVGRSERNRIILHCLK